MKGFARNGFIINGIDERGFNINGELACEEKVKQATNENPWNNYYASEVFRSKYEIMKECDEADPNTYQYATLHSKKQKYRSCYNFSRSWRFIFFNFQTSPY